MYSFNFEKLEVWQEAKNLTADIYRLTSKFPKSETYGLTSQVRRSSISICLNIAEGAGKKKSLEKAQFYRYAYGSLMETMSGLLLAVDIEHLEGTKVDELRERLTILGRRISALEKATTSPTVNRKP